MRLGVLFFGLCLTAVATETWYVQRVVSLEYPAPAQWARIQGTLELVCTIGIAGEVVECKANSGHPLLQTAAIANAKKWHFQREASSQADGSPFLLRYGFVLLEAAPVRHRPNVEFSFEYPNHVRITSEIPCIDHAPCTPEELRVFQQRTKR